MHPSFRRALSIAPRLQLNAAQRCVPHASFSTSPASQASDEAEQVPIREARQHIYLGMAQVSTVSAIESAREFDVSFYANNKSASRSAPYPAPETVSLEGHTDALANISQWPGYRVSPLHSLTDVAKACGVESLVLKDEGDRFGIGSFKALGGALAVSDLARKSRRPSQVTVATASAGNHGVGVAWGASMAGCNAVVYLHAGVAETQAQMMRDQGARTVRVDGNYDDSVRQCRADSQANDYHVIQDVSWDGYTKIPSRIWTGYTVLAGEMLAQLKQRRQELPTHILVNAGVGGFAAAMCGHLWERLGAQRPIFITVEPAAADCLLQSGMAGELTPAAPSAQGTIMTGLNCSEVAPLAWKVLETGVDHFVTVGDECVTPCMQLLATHGVVAGESGVAGVGVLLAAATNPQLKAALKLNSKSRVAAILCEGAIDPASYFQRVGMRAEQVTALNSWTDGLN